MQTLHKIACKPDITAQCLIKFALLNNKVPVISPCVVLSVQTIYAENYCTISFSAVKKKKENPLKFILILNPV
jgi:hypothetical protein